MYADNAVIFTHADTDQEASQCLTSLKLYDSNVLLKEEELEIVNGFRYLGVLQDPTLSFKNHVKRISKTVKFNLFNCRHIRPSVSGTAARMFLHSMIFLIWIVVFTNWSQTNATTLKPIGSPFKRAFKSLDRKPFCFHHYITA